MCGILRARANLLMFRVSERAGRVISSPSQRQTTGRPPRAATGNGLESPAVVLSFRLLPSLYRLVLPETRERQCPRWGSQQIVHAGQVIAFSGMIKAAQQCEVCGTAFWFLRMRMPCRLLDLDARGRTVPLVVTGVRLSVSPGVR
jgi:hypothetical protein